MAESRRWVSNIKISIPIKKEWFTYAKVSFKQDEYHIYMAQLPLQSLESWRWVRVIATSVSTCVKYRIFSIQTDTVKSGTTLWHMLLILKSNILFKVCFCSKLVVKKPVKHLVLVNIDQISHCPTVFIVCFFSDFVSRLGIHTA